MVSATARLSEGKIAEFKDAFDLFTEATGTELLKNEDLPELMRGLGELLTETDAKALQGKAGPMIDFPSFLNIMAARMDEREKEGTTQTLAERLDNAFEVLDPQGRGFIEEAELKHLLMTLGDKLSEEDVSDMLKDAERTEENHIKLPIRSLYS